MVRHNLGRTSFKKILFLCLAIFLLLGGAVYSYKFLTGERQLSFGKYQRFSLVINQKPLAVVSLDTYARRGVVIFLPEDLLVQAAHGYGRIPLGSVYQVGKLDSRGREVLADTISDYLGLPIDTVLSPKSTLLIEGSVERYSLLKPEIFQDASADRLGLFLLALNWVLLRSDKISILDPLSAGLVEKILLADGSEAKSLDPEKLDGLTSGLFYSHKIRSESLRISVVNTTSIDGLAIRATRLLSNFGASVVAVENSSPEHSSCEVFFREPKTRKSSTVNFIQDFLGCQSRQEPTLDNRFDLAIILGREFAQKVGVAK